MNFTCQPLIGQKPYHEPQYHSLSAGVLTPQSLDSPVYKSPQLLNYLPFFLPITIHSQVKYLPTYLPTNSIQVQYHTPPSFIKTRHSYNTIQLQLQLQLTYSSYIFSSKINHVCNPENHVCAPLRRCIDASYQWTSYPWCCLGQWRAFKFL